MKMFKIVFNKRFDPIWIKCSELDKTDLHHHFLHKNEEGLVTKIEQIENRIILRVREVQS